MGAQKCHWLIAITVLVAALSGCRPPDGDPIDTNSDTESQTDLPDPDTDDGCPDGHWDKFDNTDSPYEGGDEQIKVEVSFLTDYRCPYCATFADMAKALTLKPEYKKYVRFYYHHFPIEALHPGTTEIHAATYAAFKQGNASFWQLHDAIFAQKIKTGQNMTLEQVQTYAQKTLGLDMTTFDSVRQAKSTLDFIKADRDAATAQGVRGTPSVFVCGTKLANWLDLEKVVNSYLPESNLDAGVDAGN